MREAPEKRWPQFSLKTMLLAMVVAAVVVSAPSIEARVILSVDPTIEMLTNGRTLNWWLVSGQLYYAPLWLPMSFIGYAIGRRSLTPWMVATLLLVEALSMIPVWIRHQYWPPG